MAKLTDCSAQLMASICANLDTASLLSLRLTSQVLKEKSKSGFIQHFKSVKISLCQISIDALDDMTQDNDIAESIEHMTIGTETLIQYRHAVNRMHGSSRAASKINYQMLLEQEILARTETPLQLQEICHRLPNLKTLCIEDRPSTTSSDENHYASIGSTQIRQWTGVDLRWNGPYQRHYPQDHPSFDPTNTLPNPPVIQQRYAYTVVFVLIRDLHISGKRLNLDIKMRVFQDEHGKAHFGGLFSMSNPIPRFALGLVRNFQIDRRGLDDEVLERWLIGLEGLLGQMAQERAEAGVENGE